MTVYKFVRENSNFLILYTLINIALSMLSKKRLDRWRLTKTNFSHLEYLKYILFYWMTCKNKYFQQNIFSLLSF